MATTAENVLNLARSFLGYREGPRNNQSQFGAYTGFNFQPWCGSFVKYVLDHAGQTGEPSPVYTPAGATGYMHVKRWIPRNGAIRPGDVIFFDWQHGQAPAGVDHTGFVERDLGNGQVQTIEGNTASGQAGNQSNGGGVYRRVRNRNVIAGFGRPAYVTAAPTPTAPPAPQPDPAAIRRWVAGVTLNSMRDVKTPKGGQSADLQVAVIRAALDMINGNKALEAGLTDLQRITYSDDLIRAVWAYQCNLAKLGIHVKDFPGAIGDETKWWLCVSLQNIRDGKA
jgi:hypothetical protein